MAAKFDHFEPKKQPDHALKSHATLRVHEFPGIESRVEVGFRVSLEMEKIILKQLLKKESLRRLARTELKTRAA